MRSEREILELILDVAKDDERIRAVILNGSRANPNAPQDIFQDFDVVYLVTHVTPFMNNAEWVKRFGEIMIMQMPEAMGDPPPSNDGGYSYLMQFTDGHRIDLWICPLTKLEEIGRDSLSLLLLDKDEIIKPLVAASENDYLPKPPTAKAFDDCCNEFWWVSTYVAKGLWRRELTYAKSMFDQVVREELMKMMTWYLGMKTGFAKNLGYRGKYFQQYMEPELWQMLQEIYAGASYDDTWEALFTTCELFRTVALPLAERYGFDYPHDDDKRVSAHLKHVRYLPRDATEMY